MRGKWKSTAVESEWAMRGDSQRTSRRGEESGHMVCDQGRHEFEPSRRLNHVLRSRTILSPILALLGSSLVGISGR